MKRLLTFFIVVIIYTSGYSQTTNIQWAKCLGGSGAEQAQSIMQTMDGGYIVNGSSNSTDGQVTGNHGGYDYWVVKLNDTGGIQWEQSFGGSQDEQGNYIIQTPDSGYIVAGGAESNDGDVTCGIATDHSYWIVKLNSSGSIVWDGCYGGGDSLDFSEAWSVALAPDSNYIVCGESAATDGEVTGNHGGTDYWVILLSSTGSLLWEKCYGGSAQDLGKMAKPTADGGYIIIGSSASTNGQVTGNHGATDYWVVKTDDTGGIQWEKSLGGTSQDEGQAVQQTYDGGYIVAGYSNSDDGQVTGHHGDTTTTDYWVVKLDDTGGIQWEKSLGGSGDDNAYSVQQTLDSGYIISGSSASSDGDVTFNYGEGDFWVVKLNKYGTLIWQKSFGGSLNDVSYSIQQTADSGYITAGVSNSIDGNVTGNHGGADYWVVKLSAFVDSPVIINNNDTLSTTLGYNTYQWYYNGTAITGATSSTYDVVTGGAYAVYVTDSNGCKGISIPSNAFNLGVKTISRNSVITLMPNPTTGAINIKGAGLVNISIYNVLGQLMKEADNTDNTSIAELPSGVYFVRLTNDEGTVIYQDKVIKQ